MDGHESNADTAESGGEANPSASGRTDGRLRRLEWPLKEMEGAWCGDREQRKKGVEDR